MEIIPWAQHDAAASDSVLQLAAKAVTLPKAPRGKKDKDSGLYPYLRSYPF